MDFFDHPFTCPICKANIVYTSMQTVVASSQRKCPSCKDELLIEQGVAKAVSDKKPPKLAVEAFTAIRRGELRGLRWEDYRGGELHIGRSIWNGHQTDPKSEESKNLVPVIPKLATILAEHRQRQGNPISGWMFPNGSGTAADLNNFVRRFIVPALKARGIQWHGWHGFRRGLATNLNRLGVPDKITQRILRHSNVAVTQESYIKPQDADSVAAMTKFENSLNATQWPPAAKVVTIQ